MFSQWLTDGIMDLAALTNDASSSHDPTFYCGLPRKYAPGLEKGGRCMVLIDDLTGIMLETPELTREWQILQTNLGEGWLPFAFNLSWLQLANTPLPARTVMPSSAVTRQSEELPVPQEEPTLAETHVNADSGEFPVKPVKRTSNTKKDQAHLASTDAAGKPKRVRKPAKGDAAAQLTLEPTE